MQNLGRFRNLHLLLLFAWAAAAALILWGFIRDEGELTASNTVKLMDYGFSRGDIEIVQERAGLPLRITRFNRTPSPDEIRDAEQNRIVFNREQWGRVEQLVNQFVALSNWGLSDPFLIEQKPNGAVYVKGFHASDFSYRNPFAERRPEQADALISSSARVGRRRAGWLVVGSDLLLFLDPAAVREEVKVGANGAAGHDLCLVARRFVMSAPDGGALRLSVGSAPVAEDKSKRLQVEKLNRDGETVRQWLYKDSDYFSWDGRGFVIHGSGVGGESAAPSAAAGPKEVNREVEDLVFTKYINGRPSRVHLLGEATTNLLGARLGGFTTALDGALDHGKVKQLTLTLDPVLQLGSYFYLREALGKIDGHHPLGRQRRGAVTVLDLEGGGILADAGYPSFEPDWLERRRVLVNRNAVRRSPTSEVHMAGSAVKVMTVSIGYLLYADARAALLPRSKNDLAIRQAFQDVYGAELTAPLEGDAAAVTPQANSQFQEHGTPRRVRPEFLSVLQDVFNVSPDIVKSQGETEPIVSRNLLGFFDAEQLEQGFYPRKSRFPVLDATSMEQFRHYALGGEEARFTTLRLASILATAVEGKVVHPYIVESVLDRGGSLVSQQGSAFGEINLPIQEIEYRRSKMRDITPWLEKVLVPDGTGFFYTDRGAAQYLRADDPTTPAVNEAASRSGDCGKSGTANYDDDRQFNDSLFVYRHGRFAIAVWMEHADAGARAEPAHKPFEYHAAHRLTHRILQLVEALENEHDE